LDIPLFDSYIIAASGSPYAYLFYGVVILLTISSFICLSYISYFETEFFSLTASEVAEVKISNDPKFKRLKNLSEDLLKTLGAVIISRYFNIAMAFVLGEYLLFQLFVPLFIPIEWVCLIIFVILFILFYYFAEVLPGRMVEKNNPSSICKGSVVVSFFYALFRPFVNYMVKSTNVVERRLESRTQRSASIEDISDALNMSDADSSDEKEMLRGMVNFGKTTVDEIMQPRVDIVDVDFESDFEMVLKIIRESEYSRLPVYSGSIDDVKGILYIKDFLQYTDQNNDFKWQNYIREAYFVPENKKIDSLFKEFQQKHIHMAIVVDEFGGTAGIVTMEDIIEVIVGDICDEHDEEEKQVTKIGEHSYLLDAKLLLSDFYRIEGIDKEKFETVEGDADTLAGLILEVKGSIPSKGEKIEIENYVFEVVSADKRRILEVMLSINEKQSSR
jgi:gliding motility-associated protein GldE